MNSTEVLRYIETELGFKFTDLELDEEEILKVVKNQSLYTFSRFYPYTVRHLIDINKDKVEGIDSRYYIKTDWEIQSVKQVFLSNMVYDGIQIGGIYNVNYDYLDNQFVNDFISMASCPVTFMYHDEDKTLEIFPAKYTKGTILTEIYVVHSEDFSTIDIKMRDEFLKLALYDVQKALYLIRKRFANLNTPYGNIELFIDDLQDATSKRDELLERWRHNFYKSPKRKKIFIA